LFREFHFPRRRRFRILGYPNTQGRKPMSARHPGRGALGALAGAVYLLMSFPVAAMPAAAGTAKPVDVTDGNVAIGGYDAVGYFADGRAEPGSKGIAYDWNGATWRFASARHKAMFAAEPQKYAPQYGGHSAYAMSRGELKAGDPQVWSIVDGKLYLNRNEQAREKWLAALASYIDTADLNWQKRAGGPD
jgi:hypothetical protein